MVQLRYVRMFVLVYTLWISTGAPEARAQLNDTFGEVFDSYLSSTGRIALSGTFHGNHFLPAAELAAQQLAPALSSMITSNISSFPLSATQAGVTFDFSTGTPVPLRESLGPIFAETGETLGQDRLHIGFNLSFLSLDSFRGMPVSDMQFTFAHVDQEPQPPFPVEGEQGNTFGNPTWEHDTIDLSLDLDVNATLTVLYASYGLSNRLDLGVALPLVQVSMQGTSRAVIDSYTYGKPANNPEFEGAAHRFGGDALNPILEAEEPYDASATGIGDLVLRMKYNFGRRAEASYAALVDVRLPTGSEDDFLGSGATSVRLLGIASRQFGDFAPHLNVGYDLRLAERDSDEFEFAAGFDHQLTSGVTLAVDVLGSLDLNADESIALFPGTVTLTEFYENELGTGRLNRTIDLSNIPERDYDHVVDASVGMRAAPSDKVLLLFNLLIPLNDGGLRSRVAPTFGATFTL